MRSFRSGFSKRRSQSTASFNPVVDSSHRSDEARNIKVANLDTKYRYTLSFISAPDILVDMSLDKRIGHVEIEIKDRCKVRESPIHEDWFGIARIEGETFPFSTNHYELEIGERYHVVYEKIEPKTGELGIKIHDTIS